LFNIVLFEPEIPPNTGNIIRLASNTGCRLHLIAPLGFSLEEKSLRRAGLDYHEYTTVLVHEGWAAFLESQKPEVLYALSTKCASCYSAVDFKAGDYLLFGPETRGLPTAILADAAVTAGLRLPMMPDSRSLNLSNTVAVVVYEAWRQQAFAGGNVSGVPAMPASD